MKKTFLLLLITLASLSSSGQLIHGRVLDMETKEPIDFAAVFFNGTFHGTTTGEKGEFELDVRPYRGRTLQISAMGYTSTAFSSLDTENFHEVFLERAIYEISEVSVESKSLARNRKAYMRLFRDEFIGLTRNAGDCHILNEEDITFNYHSCRDTLRATARKPLIIIREVYEKKREKAYAGSCNHFFSALWMNRIEAEGFSVQEQQSLQPVTYGDMVIEVKGKKFLSYHETLEIYYNHFLSTLTLRGPGVYFAVDGYFEPEGILWYGNMSMDRIAEWLPYEYSPL